MVVGCRSDSGARARNSAEADIGVLLRVELEKSGSEGSAEERNSL